MATYSHGLPYSVQLVKTGSPLSSASSLDGSWMRGVADRSWRLATPLGFYLRGTQEIIVSYELTCSVTRLENVVRRV